MQPAARPVGSSWKNKPFFATKLRRAVHFSKPIRQFFFKSIKRFQSEHLLVPSNLSFERSQQRSPRIAAEVPLLPRPRGKKPRRILRLPVPREEQKLKYQPSAGPKSPKDRRPLGKLSIVLPLWRWMLRIRQPQSGGIPPPPPPLWSALPPPPNPNPPPNPPPGVSKLSLAELFEQLPKPFLVLGDFNAHSPAWGDSRWDGRERMLEGFIGENDFIILNSGEQTVVPSAHHSTSAIDLAVASPSIAPECSWAAHSDLCGSDHFPIFLTLSSNFSSNVNTSFNSKKADWNRFGDLCKLSLDDTVADIEQFTSKLLDAARSSIPFHKGTKNKTRLPRNVGRLFGKGKRLKGSILKRLILKIL
ncbi:RNA-directed DNA polymerase from mobile element jockey [Plakobranchus ocellatus]|uniref:RNA-directed DNA polymerase from mobile element jockey n=1 Tax=Plakobranchus ocellatus TaxID=259542 RepID=A0AAV4E1T9_9GAST|nr:RNA-directed DNA polymerase from mobile element jockey [Plakobranchus ocellatus]